MRSTPLLLCTLFVVLGPAGAAGQSFPCARPPKPAVPTAAQDHQRMLEVSRRVDRYVQQIDAYLKCLTREMENARVEGDDTVAEWNRTVAAFNARPRQ